MTQTKRIGTVKHVPGNGWAIVVDGQITQYVETRVVARRIARSYTARDAWTRRKIANGELHTGE